jgi:hypothetical protein
MQLSTLDKMRERKQKYLDNEYKKNTSFKLAPRLFAIYPKNN